MRLYQIKIGEQFKLGGPDGLIYTKTAPQIGGIANRHSGRVIQQHWHHCKVVIPVTEQEAIREREIAKGCWGNYERPHPCGEILNPFDG